MHEIALKDQVFGSVWEVSHHNDVTKQQGGKVFHCIIANSIINLEVFLVHLTSR